MMNSLIRSSLYAAWFCFISLASATFANASEFGEAYTQPIRLIRVATGESGRVANVNVVEGDRVLKGETLLKLDSTILEATRRSTLAEAESRAAIDALEIEFQLAERRHAKVQEIAGSGAGSMEELWRAEANKKVAHCRLNEAKEKQRKNKLRVDEIDARIQARSLLSPINGTVVDVHFDEGELIPTNEPRVITVVDLSALRATFYLPTSDAIKLKKNDTASLSLEDGRKVKGKIEYVGIVTEYESGRVRVRVLIDNMENQVRSGMRCTLDQR